MPDIPILGQPKPEPTPEPTPGAPNPDYGVVMPAGVGYDLIASPDPQLGRGLIQLNLKVGLTMVQVALTIATAEQLGPIIAAEMAKGVAHAKRVLAGVILPSDLGPDAAADLLRNLGNGHGPTGGPH